MSSQERQNQQNQEQKTNSSSLQNIGGTNGGAGVRSLSNPRTNTQNAFSPTNGNGASGFGAPQNSMSNFFNTRGPIRPQNLLNMSANDNTNSNTANNNARPGSASSQNNQLLQAKDFIRQDQDAARMMPTHLDPAQQQLFMQIVRSQQEQSQPGRARIEYEYGEEDDEYNEEDDASEQVERGPQTSYTPEQQEQILRNLQRAGSQNEEFMKVLDILQKDEELRPLIFEHETLLIALKDMQNLKAESMLSILTAAETEMYESSKARDDLQATNQDLRRKLMEMTQTAQILQTQHIPPAQPKPEMKNQEVVVNLEAISQIQDQEKATKIAAYHAQAQADLEKLKRDLQDLQIQNLNLTQELSKERELRENQEREQECTFKNLYDECQQLKKANETLKKQESDAKYANESKEKELLRELNDLRSKLRNQEEMRLSILDNKSKIEQNLKKNEDFIQMLQREIQMLEKENDNAHRKLNSTLNSILFQSHINQNFMHGLKAENEQTHSNLLVDNNTPARRNLSTSFQNSGLLNDQKNEQNSLIGQPVFGYGQSTQRLKLLMSENNRSQGTQSFIAHSIYYGLGNGIGGNNQNNNNPGRNIYFPRGDSLVRSNSIEVILLDDKESQKQNAFQLGEEEKHNQSSASGVLTNKQSWLRSKGLFTDLSPINSIASQQQLENNINNTSSLQNLNQPTNQRLKDLQDARDEQTQILGTFSNNQRAYPEQVKYYEDQIRKMQMEIERYKMEVKELTVKLGSNNITENSKEILKNEFLMDRTDESPYNDTSEERKVFTTPQNNNILSSQYNMQQNVFGDTNYKANIQMTSNINPLYSNEQSPMMATFSNQKERQFYSQYNNIDNQNNPQHYSSQNSSLPKTSEADRLKMLEEYNYKIQNEFGLKLKEIGTKLISLFKRFNPHQNELNHYYADINVSLIKELIMDITNRLDQMIEIGALHHQSKIPNTPSQGVLSQGVNGQPFQYFPQSMQVPNLNFGIAGPGSFSGQGHPTWLQYPNSAGNMILGSQIGQTTLDQTPLELKTQFLEEKEKRLKIVEELQRTQGDIQKYRLENDRLKQELNMEKQNNQTMLISNLNMEGFKHDRLVLEYQNLQRKLDLMQDENTTLKIEITEAHSELREERDRKKLSLDHSFDLFKDQLKSQVEDQRSKFDQDLFSHKQKIYELNNQVQSLLERNQILKEDLKMKIERITELEQDYFQQFKDRRDLEEELSYEQLKTSQFSNQKNQGKQSQSQAHQMELQKKQQIINSLEIRIQEMTHKLQQSGIDLQQSQSKNQLKLMQLDAQISKVEQENFKLQQQNMIYKEQLDQSRKIQSDSFEGGFGKDNQIFSEYKRQQKEEKQRGAEKFRLILIKNELRRKFRALLNIIVNYISQKIKIKLQSEETLQNKLNQSASFNNQGNNNHQRERELELQLYEVSQVNGKLCVQLGKALRAINQRKPIKINLSGLITKQTIDYITFGLKDNNQIFELNLQKCQLEDDDLQKLCLALQNDQGLVNLRIGSNQFQNLSPLFDFLRFKSRQLQVLDISNSKLDIQNLEKLTALISQLINLQELSLANLVRGQLTQNTEKVQQFIKAIVSVQSLKCLDFSKNQVDSNTLNFIFAQLKKLKGLESLSVSNLQIQDENCKAFIDMLATQDRLRKLNLLANRNISSLNCEYILQQLKQNSNLEELDFSKCQINTTSCIQALAQLIESNKNLRTLYISKVHLTDQLAALLVKPICDSLNIENLKIDQNEFSHQFIEKICSQMIKDKINPNQLKQDLSAGQLSNNTSYYDNDSNLSILQGANDTDKDSSMIFSLNKSKGKMLNQGLITLSLEGNKIGDKGTLAIANLIKTPNQHTKKIKSINLSKCAITSVGFENLRQALQERGNQAQGNPSITHIKISIEGNDIN